MLRFLGRSKREEERRDELLSAYLDEELTIREREQLEARLSQDPALRAELRALHQTVSMMRELPQVSAPRNFILSESVVGRRQPALAPEPRRAWAAPLLTAATVVVSLLFVVVLAGDLLLPGVGGYVSAPEPMWSAEEAAPMVLELEEESEAAPEFTSVPLASPEASREGMDVGAESEEVAAEMAEAPEVDAETTKTEAEETVVAATKAAEAPPGAGVSVPPAADADPTERGSSLAVPTVAPTVRGESVVTPTIPAEEPGPSEDELELLAPTPEELDVTPLPIPEDDGPGLPGPAPLAWRALEVMLGLAALALTVTTIQAWRARRG